MVRPNKVNLLFSSFYSSAENSCNEIKKVQVDDQRFSFVIGKRYDLTLHIFQFKSGADLFSVVLSTGFADAGALRSINNGNKSNSISS